MSQDFGRDRAVRHSRRARAGHRQLRSAGRHDLLPGAGLLQSRQCPLDPYRQGDRQALRGSEAAGADRPAAAQHVGLHQRLRPSPFRQYRHSRRRQERHRALPDLARRQPQGRRRDRHHHRPGLPRRGGAASDRHHHRHLSRQAQRRRRLPRHLAARRAPSPSRRLSMALLDLATGALLPDRRRGRRRCSSRPPTARRSLPRPAAMPDAIAIRFPCFGDGRGIQPRRAAARAARLQGRDQGGRLSDPRPRASSCCAPASTPPRSPIPIRPRPVEGVRDAHPA